MTSIDPKQLYIFTDGASLGNPGSSGWGAVIVFPQLDEIIELGGGKPLGTNNEMELTAVVAAISYSIHNTVPINLYTDSKYVVHGITKWAKNWAANGWMTQAKNPVSHREHWENLVSLVAGRGTPGKVSWNVIPGHVGIPGNERADAIASGFAAGKDTVLYRGKMSDYPHGNVLDFNYDPAELAKRKESRKGSGKQAYSYVSHLDGVTMRHKTWAETEARVKGKNAKFRKAFSADHEQEIFKAWGVTFDE